MSLKLNNLVDFFMHAVIEHERAIPAIRQRTAETKQETRSDLIEYVEELESDSEELKSIINGSATELVSNMLENNGSPDEVRATFVAHPIFALFALQMADFFVEAGGKNYVEVLLGLTVETKEFTMTIQKREGKSPHQLRMEAEALVARLKDRLRWKDWPDEKPGDDEICAVIFGVDGAGLFLFKDGDWWVNGVKANVLVVKWLSIPDPRMAK